MKKLLGLILAVLVVTGFSGIAESTPISATEFRGYQVEINMNKLNDLYSRILGQPKAAPLVRFRENPNNTNYLALCDPDKYEILFYFPNWPSNDTRDREVFEKMVIQILAHECGHAIGFENQPPSPDARMHKKVAGFLRSILLSPLSSVVIFVTCLFAVIAGKKGYTKVFLAAVVVLSCSFALAYLLVLWRENLAGKIGNQLTSQYGAEFHEIVKVIKK